MSTEEETDVSIGFEPPPYPYDRLNEVTQVAERFEGGAVDLSIGTPTDAPPAAVVAALAGSQAERGYPPSIGTLPFRQAASAWLRSLVGADVDPELVRATIGSKEFVAGLPHYLRLRRPDKDTVLYPAVSYPSYAMGAELGGCRAVPVPVDDQWRLDLGAIDPADSERALALWVNTPGNPAGGLDDLAAVAAWGRERDVPVFSDECYIEFTWTGPPHSILEHGTDGVVAVHSLSKRSNLAGVRAGFYAGDADLVHYLGEVRKHAGFMVPGPVQSAAQAALADQAHVEEQRQRYQGRLELVRSMLAELGVDAELPGGGFYLWVPAPGGDAWAFTERLARTAGIIVSPGEFYGEAGREHVRIAVVQPDERLELAAARLGLARP